jgi:hypothetical protein
MALNQMLKGLGEEIRPNYARRFFIYNDFHLAIGEYYMPCSSVSRAEESPINKNAPSFSMSNGL